MALHPKRQRFADEYLVDLNATKAAERAGYSTKSASAATIGSRLLQDAEVAKAVADGLEAHAARRQNTADRVLKEIAMLAFADQRGVMSWGLEGIGLRPSVDLTDDEAAAVVDVSVTTTGKQTTLKVKTADKLSALRMFRQHLGLTDAERVAARRFAG